MQVREDISTVYFIQNHRWIKEAEVIAKCGDLYTLKFDGCKGTRLRAGRLFPTYELAEQGIRKDHDGSAGTRPPLLH